MKKNWPLVVIGVLGLALIIVGYKDLMKKGATATPTVEAPKTKAATPQPTDPTPPKGDPNRLRFTKAVEVVFDVEKPRYECRLVGAGATEAPRPPVPKPAVERLAPKVETTKVLVLNGLRYSVTVNYRTEASSTGELGTEGGLSQTLQPGEEALIEGVVMGEVLTARVLDPAGKVSGTYHCRVIPGPGPVRMWHVLNYTQLRK